MVVILRPEKDIWEICSRGGTLCTLFNSQSLLKAHCKYLLPFFRKYPVLIPHKMEIMSTANLIVGYSKLSVGKHFLLLQEGVNLTIYSQLL